MFIFLDGQIARDNTNPIYKERFIFNMEPDELNYKNVNFQVFETKCCEDSFYNWKNIAEKLLAMPPNVFFILVIYLKYIFSLYPLACFF